MAEETVSSSSNTPDPEFTGVNEVVLQLAKGLLELHKPPLDIINEHLKEIIGRQESLHSVMKTERQKIEDLQNEAILDALLGDIATTREKLTSMSTAMMTLHKRLRSLQVRASNVEEAARSKASKADQITPSTSQ